MTAVPPYRGFKASHFDARLQQIMREAAERTAREFEELLGQGAAHCPGALAVETGQHMGCRIWRVLIPIDLVFDPFAFSKEKR